MRDTTIAKYGSGSQGPKAVAFSVLVEALGFDHEECFGQLADQQVNLVGLVEALAQLECPEAERIKLRLDGTIPDPVWPARPSPRDPKLQQALRNLISIDGEMTPVAMLWRDVVEQAGFDIADDFENDRVNIFDAVASFADLECPVAKTLLDLLNACNEPRAKELSEYLADRGRCS